jgi:hypothetical protein
MYKIFSADVTLASGEIGDAVHEACILADQLLIEWNTLVKPWNI